jgi:hypothetical protein
MSQVTEAERVRRAHQRGARLHGAPYVASDSGSDGQCEICGARGRRDLDHCHKHDTARGLVCRSCNATMKGVDARIWATVPFGPYARVAQKLADPASWPEESPRYLVYAGRCQGCIDRAIEVLTVQTVSRARTTILLEVVAMIDQSGMERSHGE